MIIFLILPSVCLVSCGNTKNLLPKEQKGLNHLNKKIYELRGKINLNNGSIIQATEIQISEDSTEYRNTFSTVYSSIDNKKIDNITFNKEFSFPNLGQTSGITLVVAGLIIGASIGDTPETGFILTDIAAAGFTETVPPILIVSGIITFIATSHTDPKWVIDYR